MTYVRAQNGEVVEYPLYEGDIRLRYRDVSFSSSFSPPTGYEPVTDVRPPKINYTQNLAEGLPVLIDGVWTRQWNVTDAAPEEVAKRIDAQWQQVRRRRNHLLADCDWTQLPDAPVDAAAWASYRQSLRDITEQTDPFNIAWPTPPGLV